MKKIYLSILVIGFIFYIGCSKDNLSNNVKESDNAKKISVAVSIIPEETFVKAVGGDLVDVITMIPPGGSPTNYQPTIQQMTKLSDSKLYFSIGVAAEEANIKPKLKEYNENINLVKLEDVVSEAYEDRFFEEEEHEDEHV
ncbi:MAG: zinc ABC transporter substrate-binding protein, partial [Clostridiales bacterium]